MFRFLITASVTAARALMKFQGSNGGGMTPLQSGSVGQGQSRLLVQQSSLTGSTQVICTRSSSICSCCMQESNTRLTCTHTLSLTPAIVASAASTPGQLSTLAFL